MPLSPIWLTTAILLALLPILQRLVLRLKLPGLPMRLAAAAVLAWAALASVPHELLPIGYRSTILVLDKLLLSYLGIRLVLWITLEVPPALGWARPRPQILVQLLMLSGGTIATVIVFREVARFDVVGLVTTSAVLTAVLGLAAQEPLKDLFAGLELQLDDVFEVGDFIDVGEGILGTVVSVNWRDTCLKDITGALVVIPNTKVTEVVVKNYGRFGSMGNRFSIGLDYALPPAQARQLVLGVLEQHPRVLKTPCPAVRVENFADSAITYEILAFQPPGNLADRLNLRSELLEQIWYAMERNGHSVPYPVRELRPKRASLDEAHPTRLDGDQRVRQLALNPLFSDLEAPETTALARQAHCVRFGPGELIVREGDPGESLYQLIRGRVEVLKRQASGAAVRVAQLSPGDIFGEMSLLTGSPRSATVVAREECLLLEVAQAHLAPLLQDNPALMNQLAHLVTARRSQLEGLSRERVKAQENQLLRRMQQLFNTVIF
jgi:small-conductance mechanosensitive channel